MPEGTSGTSVVLMAWKIDAALLELSEKAYSAKAILSFISFIQKSNFWQSAPSNKLDKREERRYLHKVAYFSIIYNSKKQKH